MSQTSSHPLAHTHTRSTKWYAVFPTHTPVVYMLPFNHTSPHTYRVMCYTYSPAHTLSSIRWYALFPAHMPAVSCISPPKHMCNQVLVGTARYYIPCEFQTNGYSNVNPAIFKMSRWRVCITWRPMPAPWFKHVGPKQDFATLIQRI